MNEKLHKRKRRLNEIFIVIMLVCVAYVSVAGNKILQTSSTLDEITEQGLQSKEDYLNLMLSYQKASFDIFQEAATQIQEKGSKVPLTDRLEMLVKAIKTSSDTMFFTTFNVAEHNKKYILVNYSREEYKELEQYIIDRLPEEVGMYKVLRASDKRLGDGERIFIDSKYIYLGEDALILYMAFEEQLMLSTMIQSLDVELLQTAKIQINNILYCTSVFMIIIGILSIGTMISLRKTAYEIKNVKCPYYGNKLCARPKGGNYD